MSIASAITNAQQRVANAYTAVSNKGGTLPVTQNLTNLPNAITSIPSGGSSPVINSLSITPTTSQQTYTATGGVDGYSPVTVSAVSSSIDPNILSNNIKNGVTVLGVTGSYIGPVESITATNKTTSMITYNSKVFVERSTEYTQNFGYNNAYVSVDNTTQIMSTTTQWTSPIYPLSEIRYSITGDDLVCKFSIDFTNAPSILFNFAPITLYDSADRNKRGAIYCGANIGGSLLSLTYGYISNEGSNYNIQVDETSQFYRITKQKIYFRLTYKATGQQIYEASFNGINYTQIFTRTWADRTYVYYYVNDANRSVDYQIPGYSTSNLNDFSYKIGSVPLWDLYSITNKKEIVPFSKATDNVVSGKALENIAINGSGSVLILQQS